MITREEIEAAAMAMPAATCVVLWKRLAVYKVGGKVFATCGEKEGLTFKASDIVFALLTEGEAPGRPAPGFALGRWVNVALDAAGHAEAEGWISDSHGIVAATLPRQQQTALGLT